MSTEWTAKKLELEAKKAGGYFWIDLQEFYSKYCSWENYRSYLSVIRQVKDALEGSMNQNINLIDAHSFCWLIGYNDRYQKWLEKKELPITQIVFNAFEINERVALLGINFYFFDDS